jgi:serine-aspartate repeat-containing protein C/D/E
MAKSKAGSVQNVSQKASKGGKNSASENMTPPVLGPANNSIFSPGRTATEARLVGTQSVTEGNSGSMRIELDGVSDIDRTFMIEVGNGSATRFNGDGSGQSLRGSAKDGDNISLGENRDFTMFDSQGQMSSSNMMAVTVRAGQSVSDSFSFHAWQESGDMTGANKNPELARSLVEGNETFSCRIVDPCGLAVHQPQMMVTIIENSPVRFHSPLAIDLNGDGVKSISIDRGVKFDILNNGSKQSVGWISPKDGLLAFDNNGNGKIDNGGELFGGNVGDGFAKLASFDTNKDGIVDRSDRNFSGLKIWQDSNNNGVTDAGELKALSAFGIKSLNVAHTTNNFQADLQGNILGERGSVNTTNGKTAEMIDVYFQIAATSASSILG